MSQQRLYFVAAEASGDDLGAHLIMALKNKAPDRFEFLGQGGHKMKALGVIGPYELSELSVVGFVEALMAAPRIKKCIKSIVADIIKQKPNMVILIDAWGLSIRIAKALKFQAPDIQIIKYVAPQVWATRPERAKVLAHYVDGLIALHEMDRPYFEAHGLKTEVVGYPAVHSDENLEAIVPPELNLQHDLLIVLPGSRPSEIKRLNGIFGQTAKLMTERHANLQIAVIVAPSVATLVLQNAHVYPGKTIFLTDREQQLGAVSMANCALAASGTVTTELATQQVAVVVAYRVAELTYWLFKHMAKIKYISLINILGDREIMPEFIQERCQMDLLASAVEQRLLDRSLCEKQVKLQNDVLLKMGRGQTPTHERAADAVLKWIGPYPL